MFCNLCFFVFVFVLNCVCVVVIVFICCCLVLLFEIRRSSRVFRRGVFEFLFELLV